MEYHGFTMEEILQIAEGVLTSREFAVFKARSEGGRFAAIGVPFNLSGERVRQIEARAIRRMRFALKVAR